MTATQSSARTPIPAPGNSTVLRDDPSLRPLLIFAAIAVPTGWVLLTAYQVLGLPQEAFVLATLVLGLVVPALVLTHRRHGSEGVRTLLKDAVRPPRPVWWAPMAVIGLPALVWAAAAPLGGARPLTTSLLVDAAILFVTTALIINIWEEMAWTGFVQRRAMARWGLVAGSLVTGEVKEESATSFVEGVDMIYRKFLDILKEEGVEPIKTEGEKFDPHLHQAVMQVEDDNYESNSIVEELQKGYKLKDRVIRPSMVKVNQ